MKKILLIIAVSLALASCSRDKDLAAVRGLAKRIVPAYCGKIVFEKIPQEGTFEVESVDGRLHVRGDNAISLAMGLNWYLKNCCLVTVSMHAFDPVQCPSQMPAVPEKVTKKALVKERFFLNYCTFGYTMPWWKWEDWERLVDWMALNGVTMPLATSGQEAIWLKIWQKHGLSEEQVRSYFTGPAHLPWHRMCNIDGVDAPLPQSWIDAQVDLQKKILGREREFGMTPVLPAFNGHVPGALKDIYPDAPITDISGWAGFDKQYLCHFLSPESELFQTIQKEYLQAQTELFGTDHIYGMDLFNEVEAPSWDPATLARISTSAYKSLAAVDPDAKWLQMAWMFYYDSKHWTKDNIKAYLEAVPKGKVIMLDYFIENTPVWPLTDKFFGQPYIFCYLGNFGGNTHIVGPFDAVSSRTADVLENGGENLTGLGTTLEGFGVNQFFFEYMFDRAWSDGAAFDDDAWVRNLADRRTGVADPGAEKIWRRFIDSCYVHTAYSEGPLVCGRPCADGFWHWTVVHNLHFSNAALAGVWNDLLAVDSERDSHRFDVVNTGCQTLGNYFAVKRDVFTAAFRLGDIETARKTAQEMKTLMREIDTLAAYEPQFSLARWVRDAEGFAASPDEKAYYAMNARHIVSTWGFHKQIKDYASRLWSGLVSSYYAPRWDMFLDEVVRCMEAGEAFDAAALDARIDSFELEFVDGTAPCHPEVTASCSWREYATRLRDKYLPQIVSGL